MTKPSKDEESKSRTSESNSRNQEAPKNKGLFEKIFETVLFRRNSAKAIKKDESVKEIEEGDSEEDCSDYSKKIEQLRCSCEKDPKYHFSCKHGIIWFATNLLQRKM